MAELENKDYISLLEKYKRGPFNNLVMMLEQLQQQNQLLNEDIKKLKEINKKFLTKLF